MDTRIEIKGMRKDEKALMDEQYIKSLIAEGEHQRLDFKFAINDSRKIARSLVAFANTDGGKLLVGVKDNGALAGVRSEEEYYMVEAAAQMYCKPEIPFKVTKWLVEGKTILEVDIPKLKNPSFAKDENSKWLAYVRVEDQNILANRILLEYWKRRAVRNGIYLEYTRAENELLLYLESNESITLSKFARLAHITLLEAEETLINLLCMNVIDIQMDEKGATFNLKENFS